MFTLVSGTIARDLCLLFFVSHVSSVFVVFSATDKYLLLAIPRGSGRRVSADKHNDCLHTVIFCLTSVISLNSYGISVFLSHINHSSIHKV